MRIKKIELFNFKQYYGKQEINFAGYNPKDEENVTVVYGENGKGKTSLYRALMFALYGDKFLEQDSGFEKFNRIDNEDINSELYIVNVNALKEDFESEQKGVKAYVRVHFRNDDKGYSLYRSMFGIQDNPQEIFEEMGEAKLKIKTSKGNTKIIEEQEEIVRKVNSILDKSIKNYFLFDGERIERLTRATKGQREEVAEGIKNLLNIDELNRSINALKKLKRKLRTESKKISTGAYKKILDKLNKLDNKKENLKKKIENINEELKKAQRQKSKVTTDLARFEDYKDLIKENESLEEKKDNLKDKKKEIGDKIRVFNNKAIILLAEDLVEKIFLDVNDKDFAKIKTSTKEKIVENIFKEMECICGNNIEKGSKEYKKIMNWKREENHKVFDAKIREFRDCLIKVKEYIKNNRNKARELLNDFSNTEENIEEINSKLERLQSELDNVPDEEFSNKKEYKEELIKKISDLEHQKEELEKDLKDTKEKIEEKEKEKKQREKEKNIKNEYIKKLELTEKTLKKLKKIKNQFIKDVRKDLEKEATNIFKKLIDSNTKETFKKIQVNEDYSLEIIGWNNRPFLANISAGQRQIMSLAFITALAKIAGGNDSLEIPLFMDTPFGRLSGAHRDNLLKEIPKLSPQWILLATDTEFTDVEANKLRETGKWGKVYNLKAIKDGYTQIKERSVYQFTPKR